MCSGYLHLNPLLACSGHLKYNRMFWEEKQVRNEEFCICLGSAFVFLSQGFCLLLCEMGVLD